jgi:hypothetical protein
MRNELERMRKESVVAKVQIIFQHLPGGTEGSHEEPQTG